MAAMALRAKLARSGILSKHTRIVRIVVIEDVLVPAYGGVLSGCVYVTT